MNGLMPPGTTASMSSPSDGFPGCGCGGIDVGHGSCRRYVLCVDAIKLDTTIDEAAVQALPALRPLLGREVEVIVVEKPTARLPRPKLSVDALLAFRVDLPGEVSLTSPKSREGENRKHRADG